MEAGTGAAATGGDGDGDRSALRSAAGRSLVDAGTIGGRSSDMAAARLALPRDVFELFKLATAEVVRARAELVAAAALPRVVDVDALAKSGARALRMVAAASQLRAIDDGGLLGSGAFDAWPTRRGRRTKASCIGG